MEGKEKDKQMEPITKEKNLSSLVVLSSPQGCAVVVIVFFCWSCMS